MKAQRGESYLQAEETGLRQSLLSQPLDGLNSGLQSCETVSFLLLKPLSMWYSAMAARANKHTVLG